MAPHTPPGATPSQAPNDFGLNPPSQLVLGYHWLAFLNRVRYFFSFKVAKFSGKMRNVLGRIFSVSSFFLCDF